MATTSASRPLREPGRLDREAARARTAELFDRHRRMVDGLCRGLLRNRVDAEDAAQQAFLSAYRSLLGGSKPREPVAWLAAIARNECLARIRARMREPLAIDTLASTASPSDPVEEAIQGADLAALWRAVSELPQQQREALLLREFGGLSYEELAVALAVSGSAVESLLYRARTSLRGAFASVGWASALQDALARLVSAGGAAKAGSLPVVAKALTATVGAAVIAGGAVVGERQADGHHVRPNAAPVRVVAASVVPLPRTAPAVPVVRPPRVSAPRRVAAATRVVRTLQPPRLAAEATPAPTPEHRDGEHSGGGGDRQVPASPSPAPATGGDASEEISNSGDSANAPVQSAEGGSDSATNGNGDSHGELDGRSAGDN